MSRGPGKIQRAIEDAFAKSPDSTFTVEELAPIAYPGLNQIEKKHRVAILRAAYAALERTGWDTFRSERPGGHVLFFNWLNLRSYAVARQRADFLYYGDSMKEIAARLDHDERYVKLTKPGGAWWLHVEEKKALHDGDRKRAAKLQKQIKQINSKIRGMLA